MRVGFFTAGTTGAGHLVRGLAIERALQRRGARAHYAMFAPPSPLHASLTRAAGQAAAGMGRAPIHEVAIDHEELRDPQRAADGALARALRSFAPDVLLVDLFWAPLRNVLPLPGCEAWLLVRSVPEKWFVGPPGHPYERSRFARVIAIEPGAGRGHEDETIPPVVIANPDEARDPSALREAIGVGAGERLVAVAQVGAPGEWRALAREASEDRGSASALHVFTLGQRREDDEGVVGAGAGGAASCEDPPVRLHDGARFFPLAEWLRGADAIVSGAGYNAFWEASWLGYAARARFVPFARRIDDQAWRVRACSGHVLRENGADVLAARLRE